MDEAFGISSTVSLTTQIIMIWHKCSLFLCQAMYVLNFYIFNINSFKNINMAAALLLSLEGFSKASVWLNCKSHLNTNDSMGTKFDILKNVFYNFFPNLYRQDYKSSNWLKYSPIFLNLLMIYTYFLQIAS